MGQGKRAGKKRRNNTNIKRRLIEDERFIAVIAVIIILAGIAAILVQNDIINAFVKAVSGLFTILGVSFLGLIKKCKSPTIKKWSKMIVFAAIILCGFSVIYPICVEQEQALPVSAESTETEIEIVDSYPDGEKEGECLSEVGEGGFYPGLSPLNMDADKVELSEEGFESGGRAKRLYKIMDVELADTLREKINGEQKKQIKLTLMESLKRKIATGTQPTDEEINGNKKFTSLIEKANALSSELSQKIMDEDLLLEVIELRQEAANIYMIKNLSKLLANNWNRLGGYYYAVGRYEESFNALLRAMKYEMTYITFVPGDYSDYYRHIYKTGMILQLIGDNQWLDQDTRMQAYLLSACLLETAADNLEPVEDEEYMFYSSYYAGIVNHKISNYTKASGDNSSYIYMKDAYKYYQISLQAENMRRQRNYQYEYLTQICEIGIWYNEHFGERDEFISSYEFEQCAAECETMLLRH